MAMPYGQRISQSSIIAHGSRCPGYQCHAITDAGPPRNSLESAPLAHGAARASTAVRHVALAAAGLEASHDIGPGTLAGGWRALALLHHHARLVGGDGHVAVDGDQVVRGPAVAAVRLVNLESDGVGHEYSPHSILEHAGVRAVLPKLSSVRYSMSRFTSSGLSFATWSAKAAGTSARHSTAFIATKSGE